MTFSEPATKFKIPNSKKVRCVIDFARRHRLHVKEQSQLLKLLGPMATEQELLMNVRKELNLR
jgi:hypothetical protein|nr:hypothetical protein [Neorhizobium tomejilense]